MAWLAALVADLALGVRLARRNPFFAASAVLVLATGIGATTAVYSVIREVLLRPLPYHEADRILQLMSESPTGLNRLSSAPQFFNWQTQTNAFEALAAYQDRAPALTLSAGVGTEAVRTLRVSPGYFAVFRVPFARGRAFTAAEDRAAGAGVIVLSDGFWRRHFGASDVVGQTLWLSNQPYQIVGIAARSFVADPPADVIAPLQLEEGATDQTRHLRVAGRLRAGVSVEGARRQVAQATAAFRRQYPFALGHYEFFTADTLHAVTIGPIRPMLQLVTVAVVLVLLVACANVATLLLSRGQTRHAEVAARAALGASRGRLARQLITEALVLAGLGGVAGLLLAHFGLRAILAGTGELPPGMQALTRGLSLDTHLALVATLGAAVAGALCGVLPAIVASRVDLTAIFKGRSTSPSASWRTGGAQGALLAGEVAAALVLLTAAGTLLETVGRMRAADRGFDATNVLTIEMPLAGTPFERAAVMDIFLRNALTRLASVSGVTAAAATFGLPIDEGATAPFRIEDRLLFDAGEHHGTVRWQIVTPGFFAALRIARVDGRLFGDGDARGAPAVALVNRALARRYWNNATPVGERLTLGGSDWAMRDATRQVVGIVGDVRDADGRDAEPTIYVPLLQADDQLLARQHALTSMRWIVRTAADPELMAAPVTALLERAAPGAAVVQTRSMTAILSEQIARARLALQLLSAFAAMALLLALVGLYGFVANAVRQRTQELGIRLALGASGARLLRLVVRESGEIVAGGIIVGVLASMLVGTGIETVVFGTRPLPMLYLLGAAVALLGAALTAAVVAAVPVMRLDPRSVIDR